MHAALAFCRSLTWRDSSWPWRMSRKVVWNLFEIKPREEPRSMNLVFSVSSLRGGNHKHAYLTFQHRHLIADKNNEIVSPMSLQILPNRSCYGCCISWIRNGARNNPQGETIRHFSVTHSNILMDEASDVAPGHPGRGGNNTNVCSALLWWQFLLFGPRTRVSGHVAHVMETRVTVEISVICCVKTNPVRAFWLSPGLISTDSVASLGRLIDIFSSHCHYSPKSSYREFFMLVFGAGCCSKQKWGSSYFLWSLRIRKDWPWPA